MWGTVALSVLVASGVVALSRALTRYQNRPDHAWKPTGVKPRTVWSYDEAQAIKAARQAKKRSATGRPYKRPAKRTADVVPMRRVK